MYYINIMLYKNNNALLPIQKAFFPNPIPQQSVKLLYPII